MNSSSWMRAMVLPRATLGSISDSRGVSPNSALMHSQISSIDASEGMPRFGLHSSAETNETDSAPALAEKSRNEFSAEAEMPSPSSPPPSSAVQTPSSSKRDGLSFLEISRKSASVKKNTKIQSSSAPKTSTTPTTASSNCSPRSTRRQAIPKNTAIPTRTPIFIARPRHATTATMTTQK